MKLLSSCFLSCFSTSPPFHGFLVAAAIAEVVPSDVVVAVFAAAALSAEVSVLVAESEFFALFFAAAALSAEVFVFVAEPEVVFVVDLDVSEPRASVDIAVAFVVLISVSVVVVEVDSSEHPRFHAFPNVDHFASPSSSVEVVGGESVHVPIDARTNYCLCSTLSNLDLHQSKNLERFDNSPNLSRSNASDTSVLPKDATTSLHRRRCPRLRQGQRRHTSPAVLPPPVVRQIRWAAADQY
jgi:hypothetical protein